MTPDCVTISRTIVGLADLGEDAKLLLGVQVILSYGTLCLEQVTALGECGREEHVEAAEEQVVRVHQVIVDLRVLACSRNATLLVFTMECAF